MKSWSNEDQYPLQILYAKSYVNNLKLETSKSIKEINLLQAND